MEAMERRGKLTAVGTIVFIFLWLQCRSVEGQRNNTKMSYVCPPQFIRLGHSCYFFSENKATWHNALYACSILCALSFLANGSYQKIVGKNINTYLSQTSVSRCIKEIVEALNHPYIVKKYLRFPQNASERQLLKERFYEKFHIPGVIGCVDGTFVAILRPHENEERYYCRKGFHARNVMLDQRDSNLTVPARWEDRNLRKYLNKPDVVKASRWIGGIFDYGAKSWRWGGDLRKMHYQSFSKMKKMSAEELKWHCIAMLPELLYRWSPRNCLEARHYICQTKLQKVPKAKVKDLRRRWQRMGKINEITAPSVSREVNDPMMINDVTINPVPNPKSYDLRPNSHRFRAGQKRHGTRSNAINSKYDLRPNELKKRSRPLIHRRLKRPFPGYTWNRRDPEGSYQRNADLLRSGRTGLTPQQINAHLARLRHLRDKQIARRKRMRDDDWLENEPRHALAQTHARTYTVDNNISALHPKTIVEEFNMEFPHHPAGPPKTNRNAG